MLAVKYAARSGFLELLKSFYLAYVWYPEMLRCYNDRIEHSTYQESLCSHLLGALNGGTV